MERYVTVNKKRNCSRKQFLFLSILFQPFSLPPAPCPKARAGCHGGAAAGICAGCFAGCAAVIGLVGYIVIMAHDFAFAYYITGVVGVFVNYVVFINCVVLVAHNVFVLDYALSARAVKYLAYYGFGTAFRAAVCACAIHGFTPFIIENTTLHTMQDRDKGSSTGVLRKT